MTDKKRILALSSSRVGEGNYLENALPHINTFLGEAPLQIAFIPFAFVDKNKAPLFNMVKNAFAGYPYVLNLVDEHNGVQLVQAADVIMVSGGNTFKLLHDLYAFDLLDMVKEKVNNGTPYIGWSAGSNITGATICTTNDMPIIEPKTFNAFGFFPFQINPHYYNLVIEGHNGETRDQRLTEFVKLNPKVNVVCLPEGTALVLDKAVLRFIGTNQGYIMANEDGELQKVEIQVNEDISHLL